MLLNKKEYQKLVKDFDTILEKVDGENQRDVMELVRELELKYWKYVKDISFLCCLIKTRDLDKVLWLFESITETKKKLKKMQPTDKFYDDLQKDVKYWKNELFLYWKDYDSNGNVSDFCNEMKKIKWIILKSGMNLYSNFTNQICSFT